MSRWFVVKLALAWAGNAAGIWVAAKIFDGLGYDGEWGVLLLAAAVLALVNMIVRPIVILLALPAVILSLGLVLILVNALMLWLTDAIIPRFDVSGFWTTVGAALVISGVNLVVHWIVPEERWLARRRAPV
jgi:putative membrane protein